MPQGHSAEGSAEAGVRMSVEGWGMSWRLCRQVGQSGGGRRGRWGWIQALSEVKFTAPGDLVTGWLGV